MPKVKPGDFDDGEGEDGTPLMRNFQFGTLLWIFCA